ncbi:MAG TPA: carboxypeptidase-like regulatory domain-containing protein [Candidatus Limnocylindria bacterium]|nr:carboxypeptidase-like regulatory domain-containing protein [Candidatus Limnocylindria bacterium]
MSTSIRRVAAIAALVLILAACTPAASGSGTPTTAADAARLALAQQARFAGIAPLDETLIGQAAWYQVAESADGWEVLIRIGWGDCPAGCINERRWTYAVGRDGTVELVTEVGDPLPDATGLHGVVTSGPHCPVVTDPPDPSCADRPVAGALLVVTDAAGDEVARTTSGADGSFSIELAPGAYTLVPQAVEGLMGTPEPIDVEVEAGQPMAELTVSYDTGIR